MCSPSPSPLPGVPSSSSSFISPSTTAFSADSERSTETEETTTEMETEPEPEATLEPPAATGSASVKAVGESGGSVHGEHQSDPEEEQQRNGDPAHSHVIDQGSLSLSEPGKWHLCSVMKTFDTLR